jgi:adenylylsulfate kinase-like enzyme
MNALDEVQARALAEKIVSLYSAVLVLDADNMREVFLPDLV